MTRGGIPSKYFVLLALVDGPSSYPDILEKLQKILPYDESFRVNIALDIKHLSLYEGMIEEVLERYQLTDKGITYLKINKALLFVTMQIKSLEGIDT